MSTSGTIEPTMSSGSSGSSTEGSIRVTATSAGLFLDVPEDEAVDTGSFILAGIGISDSVSPGASLL